jgi:hypothetical protein
MQGMPDYVIDYVLVHELVHLLVEGHGRDFEVLMQRYERVVEARAFLLGVDFAGNQGLAPADPTDASEGDTASVSSDEVLLNPPVQPTRPTRPSPGSRVRRVRPRQNDTLW